MEVPFDGDVTQSYRGGIFSGECYRANLQATLVGYGTDATSGVSFWILRLSWGSTYGENGYIRVKATPEGVNQSSCFIATEAFLPLVWYAIYYMQE